MKKVLYVANFLYREESGATSSARAHLDVLIKAYGEKNVYTVALIGTPQEVKPLKKFNFEICTVDSNLIKRGLNLLCGHTGKINNKIIAHISEIIQDRSIDIAFFDDSIYGLAIKRLIKKYPGTVFASYYHDVKRNLCVEWIKKNPMGVFRYLPLIWNEYLTQKYSDYNLVLNQREESEYMKYYKKKPELIFPVIMPSPQTGEMYQVISNPLKILFVGGHYYPNVNGIDWFITNVFSEVCAQSRLTIVGNNMNLIAPKYDGYDGISVYGRVEDLSPYYLDADIIIGPIFEGAGMKVKTAEAFSYGKCFLGTDESLVGYTESLSESVRDRYVFVCNTQREFVDVIRKIESRDIVIHKCNQQVVDFFEEHFSITYAATFLREHLK